MATVATWFHAQVRGVSRGDSKSAVGLAAYLTGEKLYDEENQRGTYRGHPGDVLSWGTVAPSHAPPYLTDPDKLAKAWNDAQRAETRINSHLANHWDIGLWRNASPEQNKAVMEGIAKRVTDRYGIMVTWAVHEPSGEGSEHNFHGHLAMNMRRVTEKGFGAKAREIVDGKTRHLETEWMRRMIADEINAFLKSVNADERVSHESYRQRGILKEPMVHMGANAWQAEKRGERTELGDKNRGIRERNSQHEQGQAKNDDNIKKAHQEGEVLQLNAERLERIASGKQPMEMTQGQADQRRDLQVNAFEQAQSRFDQAHELIDAHKRNLEESEKRRIEEERDAWRTKRDTEIADPHLRWSQSIRKPLGDRDSFSLLAAAARDECADFKQGQEKYRQQEAVESDPQKRDILRLRRHIEAADYMAITSERMVGVSQFLAGPRGGRGPSESENYYRDEAQKYREIGMKERELLQGVREKHDAKIMEHVHEELAKMDRRAREPIGRRGLAAQNEDRGLGQPKDLPANAPNRDRPQKAQMPAASFDPADRPNPYDRVAQQDSDRRDAAREIDDPAERRQASLMDRLTRANARGDEQKREEPRIKPAQEKDSENEATDADAERQNMLLARIEKSNQQAQGGGRDYGGGQSRGGGIQR